MRRATLGWLAGTVLAGWASTAGAGGFQRGTADTDILFEPGTFATRLGVTYVDPQRGFSSVNGVKVDGGDYTGDYVLPTAAFYLGNEVVGCAGTATESFAAEVDFTGLPGGGLPEQNSSTQSIRNVDRLDFSNATVRSRTQTIEFESKEFGATCRVSYAPDFGRFSLLGGVYFEDFHFDGSTLGFRNLNGQLAASSAAGRQLVGLLNAAAPGAQLTLPTRAEVDLGGEYKTGYRVGLAFEKPEIALRVQAVYRSEVQHDDVDGLGSVTVLDSAFVRLADGTAVSVPTFLSNPRLGLSAQQRAAVLSQLGGSVPGAGTVLAVDGSLNDATSPQSLTINAQTGIAAGTLLVGSFRWTDWSTNEAVVSTIAGAQTGTSSSYVPFFWRDGYTASLGVGRAFTENFSGLLTVGYDRGVSTGADTTYTDLYTLSGGVAFKPEAHSEFRLGGLVGYWTDGTQSISDNSYFDATVGDDFVWAVNGSFKLTF